MLRALRVQHGVSMPAVRQALAYAESRVHIRRLLLSNQLAASAGRQARRAAQADA